MYFHFSGTNYSLETVYVSSNQKNVSYFCVFSKWLLATIQLVPFLNIFCVGFSAILLDTTFKFC